jgi:hypothetical protein
MRQTSFLTHTISYAVCTQGRSIYPSRTRYCEPVGALAEIIVFVRVEQIVFTVALKAKKGSQSLGAHATQSW